MVKKDETEVQAAFLNLSTNNYDSSHRKNCLSCARKHSHIEECEKKPRASTNLRFRKPSMEYMDIIQEHQMVSEK